jgi:putative ABC transport system permease protein
MQEKEKDDLIKKLYAKEGVLNAEFISERRGLFDNLITSINYIVGVIIVSSGMLAFIVLYNLTNININERKRELATLKVLGFHNEEVSSYIFREITILSIVGTLVGLLLGKYLHQFIVLTVENPNFMFGRDISILSYVLSAIITLIFSVVVDLFMIKKLRNIKMVDSLKAND